MQINLRNGFYIETDNRNFTMKQKYIGTRKDREKPIYENAYIEMELDEEDK